MKIKIKSEEELKKLGNYIMESKEALHFSLDRGNYSLHKDFICKEFDVKIHWENNSELCVECTKTGRMFPVDFFIDVDQFYQEKADQLKNLAAGEVFSIPTNNYEKLKELEELSKPLVEWLNKNFDPHHIIVIQTNYVGVQQGVLGIPMEVKD